MIQANRPVYNSQYTTTIYNNKDANFNFVFAQFDQLIFNDENIDNQLTALFAYYAYLIIGLDLDTFSPYGGTEILQRCLYLVNNTQNLNFSGWKAFEDSRNRFAIINDYLEEGMKPFRQLQYDYYRKGLDEMANNVERGRANITTALQDDLNKAHQDKPLSLLPQIWTDYKKDEITNIYHEMLRRFHTVNTEDLYDLVVTHHDMYIAGSHRKKDYRYTRASYIEAYGKVVKAIEEKTITKEQEEGLKEFLIDRIRENSFYVEVDHNIQPALFIAKVNQLGI